MIKLACSGCNTPLKVADDKAGQKVRCPTCQATVDVPDAVAEEVEDEAPLDIDVDRIRKKKPRRGRRSLVRAPREEGGEFSLIDLIPVDYVTLTNLGVGLGLLLHIIGSVLIARKMPGPGVLIALPGSFLFLVGCMAYAKNKGYTEWMGLLGLFGCIGLFILVLLPSNE